MSNEVERRARPYKMKDVMLVNKRIEYIYSHPVLSKGNGRRYFADFAKAGAFVDSLESTFVSSNPAVSTKLIFNHKYLRISPSSPSVIYPY